MYPLDVIQQELKDDVERFGRIVHFAKGESIMCSKETMEYFFVIIEGRVKVSQINLETGKEQILYLLEKGDMYDVVTLLDGKVHENSVSALDNVKVLVFRIELFRGWIETRPSFNKLFLPYVVKQLRDIEALATNLSLYDTSTRLIKLIANNLDLKENSQKLKLINNLPHEELASLIGTVRKVLNRNLQKLKKEGFLDIQRKQIHIKDSKHLLEQLPKE